MNRVFVFGTNALAEIIAFYLRSTNEQFDGFVLNECYIKKDAYSDIRLYSIEEVIDKYGIDNIGVYIAIAYDRMNKSREMVYKWLKSKGVRVLSFKHPSSIVAENAILGEGNIILEGSIIQPYVKIGNCNILWNNSTICHHCCIDSYNYIAPAATITGRVSIGSRCFIGSNCTIKNDLYIKDEVLIGAGAYVNRNLESNSVFLPAKGSLIGMNSLDIVIR